MYIVKGNFFSLNFLFYTGVYLINKIVIVSGEQQRDSANTYICIYSPPKSSPIQAAT